MKEDKQKQGTVLVIGGGISGMTTAIEAAEVGHRAIIVEKEASLGGRVARMNKYFPKLCPPGCGLEINYKRIRSNPRIRYYTLSEITEIQGEPGDFVVTITRHPRFVNNRCTACALCEAACPVQRSDEFNLGMSETKAIYYPHDMAFPPIYAIDQDVCPGSSCSKCVEACPYQAIELDQKDETFTVQVDAIVLASGWKPYDVSRLETLGRGRIPNVITNVMMERLAAPSGPTGGKIVTPRNSNEIKKIAFAQCAGSRDENHLAYCSSVCCMASFKQASYVREQYPDAEIYIYYIDIRTPGRLEDFTHRFDNDSHFHLVKGKVANVQENPDTGKVWIEVEDTLAGKKTTDEVDMLVLATGMQPMGVPPALKAHFKVDNYGFSSSFFPSKGLFTTGVAKKTVDVSFAIQDAVGMALKAIQTITGRKK